MATTLLALLPILVDVIWPVGFLSLIVVVGILVTSTRVTPAQSERDRRYRLALLAIVSGPLLGALLAWGYNATRGRMHPDDVHEHTRAIIVVGGIAGLFVGSALGLSGMLCSRGANPPLMVDDRSSR